MTTREITEAALAIAELVRTRGFAGYEAVLVLSCAMGFIMEAQSDGERDLKPLAECMCEMATQSYDRARSVRNQPKIVGHG